MTIILINLAIVIVIKKITVCDGAVTISAKMPDKFGKEALDAHNRYRSLHQAPQLKWSRSLEKDAENWAKQLAKDGRLRQGETDDGESIYAVSGKSEVLGGEVVDRWYAEVDR